MKRLKVIRDLLNSLYSVSLIVSVHYAAKKKRKKKKKVLECHEASVTSQSTKPLIFKYSMKKSTLLTLRHLICTFECILLCTVEKSWMNLDKLKPFRKVLNNSLQS